MKGHPFRECEFFSGPAIVSVDCEPHKRAIAHGHELAPKVNAGDWDAFKKLVLLKKKRKEKKSKEQKGSKRNPLRSLPQFVGPNPTANPKERQSKRGGPHENFEQGKEKN